MSRPLLVGLAIAGLLLLIVVTGVPLPGRYQLHTGPDGTFKFDAWTGSTWQLIDGWERIDVKESRRGQG